MSSPWTPLHAQIHTRLRATQWLPQGSGILIAVSGGQDSLCLAQLLVDLQPKWGWRLRVAHCDHRWRPDSGANAAHVAQLAAGWGLPCHIEQAATDLPKTEAAARTWRYQVFSRQALAHGGQTVVTGHTATDRAETVLYNLVRGSGADGLQALGWRRPLIDNQVWLVRPLLDLTRQDTGDFCSARQLPVWQDATNQDLGYRRNRIRQELMPYLRSHFNPTVETSLAQTAEIFAAEVAYLEAEATQLYDRVVQPLGPGWQLHRPTLRAAPLALQRRVVRQLLQAILPRPPQFEHIDKLVRLAAAPHRSQGDPLPGGWVARVDRDWLVLEPPTDSSDKPHDG